MSYQFTKRKAMEETVIYQFQETVFGMIPGGGVTFTYSGEARIEFLDKNGEEEKGIEILSVDVFVNGQRDPFASLPEEKIAKEFYALAREAARKAYFEKRAVWQ